MLRGAAIYGCALPTTEFFATYIASEIEIFLKQHGYADLTVSEVLLALRLNYNGNIKFPGGIDYDRIEFSGITLNVWFLSKVLEKYRTMRNLLDNKIKNFIDGYQ